MIVLHQFAISPFCEKVRRLLRLKGLRYEVREWPPSAALGALRELGEAGKVPVLEHEGRRIADSSDIARYLDEAFGEPALLPSEIRARAEVEILEDWANESLYFYALHYRWGRPHNARRFVEPLLAAERPLLRPLLKPILPRAIERTTRSQGLGRKSPATIERELDRHLASLAGWLGEREWLVGESPTLADCAVSAQLWAIESTPEGAAAIDRAPPTVPRWLERMDRELGPRRA